MRRRPPRSTRTDTLFAYTTLFRSGALGAQLLEQRFAVAFEAAVLGRLDAGLLRGLGDERVEFALRAEAQRHRVLGDDVGAVPVAALADRVDRVARRADQLADGTVRPFGMVLRSEERRVGKEWVSTCRSR